VISVVLPAPSNPSIVINLPGSTARPYPPQRSLGWPGGTK
jgi:hypothetical protein